jgi:glycosyltransferase involved in cell wall biosynthesis
LLKNILYIHFYASLYVNKDAFIKQQAASLSYKTKLGETHSVHYLLNNNLEFNERYESIQLVSKKLSRWSFLKTAVNYIKTHKCEYVIIHGLDYFLEATYIKWFSGAKIILQHHAEKTYLRKKSILMPFADKWIDGYLFNGKEIARPFLQKKCIFSINKIYEVVEASSGFKPYSNKKTEAIKQLVFIGRLNQNKNLMTLLKAIQILKLKRTDFHLSIYYTSNEQEQELKSYSAKNNLADLVSFKGSVPQNEIQTILNRSDIFVSCSLYEGSGYSLIEALACGVFPVASHIPAFDFLLTGLNESELANKLDKVLDLEFTDLLKQSIRSHFELKCSNTAITLQIESTLNQLT